MAEKKDNWEKAQVILEPVGGLLTALSVALLGIIGSNVLEKRQVEETNARLYTELTSRREESESKLRTDMFNSIIGTFLQDTTNQSLAVRILNLELLSSNFHEAIDIGPLFRHLDQQIRSSKRPDSIKQIYLTRLKEVSSDVIRKQVAVLEQYGKKADTEISFADLENDTVDNSVRLLLKEDFIQQKKKPLKTKPLNRFITISVVNVDTATRQLKVRVDITEISESDTAMALESEADYPELVGGNQLLSKEFWVGSYDLPMIDNIRLANGFRLALVLNNFDIDNSIANITVIHFPGSYSSLKERPYYEELIQNLKQTRESFEESN